MYLKILRGDNLVCVMKDRRGGFCLERLPMTLETERDLNYVIGEFGCNFVGTTKEGEVNNE